MATDTLILLRHEEAAPQARAAFHAFLQAWAGRLPASADIAHIGSTAIPGCLTKGDLDVCVRADREDVASIDALLAARYARNAGSFRSAEFSAFKDDSPHPPLGVQLVAKGSELDVFVRFRDCLWRDPGLVAAFNVLKRAYAEQSMASYRQAKADFIVGVLSANTDA
jgi:GrpB-like predicted nucleotidyltransferase (UPF0157 family)